jgi:formate hydrogenlyase transcriptional activator
LRERSGDIRLLATHFVPTFARRHAKQIPRIPDQVMEALEAHDWPGNVRELQNFIERSVIMTTGSELRAPIRELASRPLPTNSVRTLDDAARLHILTTLLTTNGVVGGRSGAAARLGLKRTTLIARMKKLGLSRIVEDAGLSAGANL